MVKPAEGAACIKAFCKGLKPVEETKIGFPAQPPKPDLVAPKAVDVDPSLIERVKRERAKRVPPPPDPEPEPEEVMPEPKITRPGLTKKQTQLFDLMEKRATDRLVKASYADLAGPVGTTPTAVMSLVKALTRERYVEIISRPGGRGKTTYRLLEREADTKPAAEPADTEPLAQTDDAPFVTAASQKCANCQFSHAMTIGHMVCRRLPPIHTVGHPKVQATDWCGEWRLK
jgi:hypothetical protein